MKVMKQIVLCLIIIVFSLAAWGVREGYERYSAVFPTLAPGVYRGLMQVEGEAPIPLLVLQKKNDRAVSIAVAKEGFKAERVQCTDPSGVTRLPLIFEGTGKRFRLTGGSSDHADEFEGRVYEALSGGSGTWTLVRDKLVPLDVAIKRDVIQWSALMAEIQRVGDTLDRAQGEMNRQQEVVGLLDERDVSDDSNTPAIETDNSPKESELIAFEALQRAGQYGRLVALSRSALARDSAWISSVLSAISYETSEDFQLDWERTKRVVALKEAIAKAKSDVSHRRNYFEFDGNEIDREREFYEQFQ